MRLYRVTATAGDVGSGIRKLVRYAGTQADARAEKKRVAEAHGLRESAVDWVEVEVPTDKPGLLAYLNALAAS